MESLPLAFDDFVASLWHLAHVWLILAHFSCTKLGQSGVTSSEDFGSQSSQSLAPVAWTETDLDRWGIGGFWGEFTVTSQGLHTGFTA